jgi:hypothetical protein
LYSEHAAVGSTFRATVYTTDWYTNNSALLYTISTTLDSAYDTTI